jgi:CDP-diacylglycerol--serine O-phosphatidyltransferase
MDDPAAFTSHLGVAEHTANELKGQDKQKMLLSENVGHFSLVRAMHLADLITLMNGTSR